MLVLLLRAHLPTLLLLKQVHKELQDTIAQLEAIRHEIRSISFVNPSPLTRSLMNDPEKNIPAKSGRFLQKF